MDLCQQHAAMVNGVYLYMDKVVTAECQGFLHKTISQVLVTHGSCSIPLSYMFSPLYEATQCVFISVLFVQPPVWCHTVCVCIWMSGSGHIICAYICLICWAPCMRPYNVCKYLSDLFNPLFGAIQCVYIYICFVRLSVLGHRMCVYTSLIYSSPVWGHTMCVYFFLICSAPCMRPYNVCIYLSELFSSMY